MQAAVLYLLTVDISNETQMRDMTELNKVIKQKMLQMQGRHSGFLTRSQLWLSRARSQETERLARRRQAEMQDIELPATWPKAKKHEQT